MSKHTKLKGLVAALPCLLMGVAHAGNVPEFEPNNPIASPMHLVAPANTSVQAVLGNGGTDDLDYYTFYANAGDVLTVDIDNGIGGAQSVDTVLAIFDTTPSHTMLRFNDDASSLDPGSVSNLDSRIDNFVVPASGYYIVGVSNYPRYFMNGGDVMNSTAAQQGDYTLVITGVTASVKQVAILVKPGNNFTAPINPRSHGTIPVAVLGGPDFDTSSINTKTLTFGSSGDEASLSKCNPQRVDLNGDGRLDLLCHFDNQSANFKLTDAEGKLHGETFDGTRFEGTGYLKVIPEKGGMH